MDSKFTNPDILERFEELLRDGNLLYQDTVSHNLVVRDPVAFTQWATSCLNLFDRLSSSTNRFVTEFEYYGRITGGGAKSHINIGTALGVLKSAKEEYIRGMAIDYHLSVSASVFSGLLDEAKYLLSKNYLRAATVLAGAALEEGLKTRARMIATIEIPDNATLIPIIHKLKSDEAGVLTEFEATKLEAIGKLRNDAAHGGEFDYHKKDVEEMILEVKKTLARVLGSR